MHLNTELLFKKHASSYFKDGMKILEIGGTAESNFRKLTNNPKIVWHTLDIDLSLDKPVFQLNHIISDKEYTYPIEDETYDIVISGNVIEHVKKIWVWVRELRRLLKNGGYAITVNPVSWPFHEAPVDCWRIYPEGAKALFEDAGFSIKISTFESLELEYFNYPARYNSIAGFTVGDSSLATFTTNNVSLDSSKYKVSNTNKFKIFYNKILSNIPFFRRMMVPVKISYDTITVAQKTMTII